jgi:hypothetical protein
MLLGSAKNNGDAALSETLGPFEPSGFFLPL